LFKSENNPKIKFINTHASIEMFGLTVAFCASEGGTVHYSSVFVYVVK